MENWPVGKKKKGENRKKIKIESTKLSVPGQPGHHTHNAMQKEQGIVKAPLRRELQETEHWIKKRNYGEMANPKAAKKKKPKKKPTQARMSWKP